MPAAHSPPLCAPRADIRKVDSGNEKLDYHVEIIYLRLASPQLVLRRMPGRVRTIELKHCAFCPHFARPSSYRPKGTVHAGYAVQIRRPKLTPHIHGSELGHSADCRQDNRRQKLNCIGCLGRCSFYEASLRFIPEDMTSEGIRTLSTEFQSFISSTVEDLKPVRKKLLCALEQPGRIVRCS
jgi:hypothetical protein